MLKNCIFIIIFLCSSSFLTSKEISFVTTVPKPGDGVYSLFRRYEIPTDTNYLSLFYELNSEILGEKKQLKLDRTYFLPIITLPYNRINIRTTLGISFDSAKIIQDYNEALQVKGIKPKNYRDDGELWALYYSIPEKMRKNAEEESTLPSKDEAGDYDIFGDKYKNIKQKDNSLAGMVYYLKSGHGGPDPGAIGYRDGYELHEDEYAYDIMLRLARNLLEHGAKVYIIVRDPKDGIRDDAYLNNSYDEYLYGGDTISRFQTERLRKRAEIINNLYSKNKKTAKKQELIILHVDSRSNGKRIDVFFYHHPDSQEGKELAETLHTTINEKYSAAQPGRGYHGTVSGRNLYMLRSSMPTSVFIELGNIRNPQDQIRLIKASNRQALANWLCDGIIKAASAN